MDTQKAAQILKRGGVGVIPTDTIYGIVAPALNENAVERVYALRKRSPDKPCIILISSIDDLKLFNINLDEKTKDFLEKIWPNKVSVILACPNAKFYYLHRGTKTLAFRLPHFALLTSLLHKTGPLIAPSANFEGEPPAQTIEEAKKYFGDKVDFYLDAGKLNSLPSTLIEIENNEIKVLREGTVVMSSRRLEGGEISRFARDDRVKET